MQIINITDCQGSNAELRLSVRLNAIFPNDKVVYAGVGSALEASGYIIDSLDALNPFGISEEPAIIITNVAPRGNKEKYPNGIPFCFQYFEKNIIIGTPDTFSLLKKFGLMSHIRQTDVLTVCEKFLDKDEASRIANSQFRSYEYLPLLARWLADKKDIPNTEIEIPDLDGSYIWCTDRFTENPEEKINCKTTAFEMTEVIDERLRSLPFHERLADVPRGEAAIIRGSSGYKSKRFLEIIVQGGSAAKTFDLQVGSSI